MQKISNKKAIRIKGIEYSQAEDTSADPVQYKKKSFLQKNLADYNGQDRGMMIYKPLNQEYIHLYDVLYQLNNHYHIEEFRPILYFNYQGYKPYNTFKGKEEQYHNFTIEVPTFKAYFQI